MLLFFQNKLYHDNIINLAQTANCYLPFFEDAFFMSSLSERELEILRHIHEGMSSKEIGNSLSLSLHTVNTHRRNILKKTVKSSIGEVIFELENIGIL